METQGEKEVKIIDMDIYPDYWKDAGMDREHYLESSYIIGDSIIILGVYKDKERKKASFFHEFGHTIAEGSDCKYTREKNAWQAGLELAEGLDITFSKECHKWIKDQLKTYKKYKSNKKRK